MPPLLRLGLSSFQTWSLRGLLSNWGIFDSGRYTDHPVLSAGYLISLLQPRIALDCEVALNNWQVWLEEATIGGARPFEAMAFTKPIRQSLKESVFNNNLVHIFVTSGEAPFSSRVSQTALAPGRPVSTIASRRSCHFLIWTLAS